MATRRAPNILVVMADQLAPHFTGAYGHPLVQTPAMNTLAERGVRFDAAYCNSPLCAPARFALMAGQTISRIGAWDNASELPAAVPTLAHYLRLMGYQTALSGKMHFVGPDQLHGFDVRLTTDIYPADFAWTPNWDDADTRIDKWYHGMDSLHEAGQAAITYQLEYDDEVAFTARRQLFDYARSADERPFFLVTSFIHPHDPYVARPDFWDRYDHDDIDMPRPVDLATLDPHSRRIRAGIQSDTVGHTEDHVRNACHGYYANVSYFDHQLGQLMATLEETEQLDHTIVMVTADHGDMLGDRGVWFKMSFQERSARVPLIVAGPGVVNRTVAGAVSHLDILPTLMDIAGFAGASLPPLGAEIDGRSLWEVMAGGSAPADEVYGEYTGEMTSQPMFMIRRGRYKYIWCSTDPAQLFDVRADPDESVNLAQDPDHQTLAADFALEVERRWDADAVRAQVVASQRARRTLHAAMSAPGAPLSAWDYQPRRNAANEYVRNHMDWIDAGPRTRFPRYPPQP